jgi:F-type H+-transporting ATPase subunit alpha
VPAQIATLLALSGKLFDLVPLGQMTEAGHALREAAANIPAEVCARFETADELSNEDRKAVVDVARLALARFQPKQEAKPEAKVEPGHGTERKPGEEAGEKP